MRETSMQAAPRSAKASAAGYVREAPIAKETLGMKGRTAEEARVAGPPLGVHTEYNSAGRHGACPARRVPAILMKHRQMRKVAAPKSLAQGPVLTVAADDNDARHWQQSCNESTILH